jgi:hypothetical protein
LVAAVDTAADADRAIAAGADMIDGSALTEEAVAAILARHSRAQVWLGTPAVVDADQVAAGQGELRTPGELRLPGEPRTPGEPHRPGEPRTPDEPHTLSEPRASGEPGEPGGSAAAPVAAVVAAAAILTWLGAPAVRTRHVVAVRRAIDMTGSIAGTRPPALTTRGLA